MEGNYNLHVNNENIDCVVLKLLKCSNVEIRNILRRSGLIKIKTNTLESVSEISEVLTIEKDTKFYINTIAIM